MKALVLGSAGQIGSHLTAHLRLYGHEVHEWDIANGEEYDLRRASSSLAYTIETVDCVFFLAFDVGGSTYLKEYQHSFQFIQNNIQIMENVFGVLAKTEVPFIFASSQMATMDHSPYGILKRLGELYTHDLNGTNVQFWNVYGHETDPKKFHVITDFIKMAHDDGVIKMRTTGEEERQFLYADDCCEALTTIATLPVPGHHHITSFRWHTVNYVADVIADLTGAKVVPGEQRDEVQGVKNEPHASILSFWHPRTSLEVGISLVNGLMYPGEDNGI
jgi:nucleoside-diphosphate-sugar epimerase